MDISSPPETQSEKVRASIKGFFDQDKKTRDRIGGVEGAAKGEGQMNIIKTNTKQGRNDVLYRIQRNMDDITAKEGEKRRRLPASGMVELDGAENPI